MISTTVHKKKKPKASYPQLRQLTQKDGTTKPVIFLCRASGQATVLSSSDPEWNVGYYTPYLHEYTTELFEGSISLSNKYD